MNFKQVRENVGIEQLKTFGYYESEFDGQPCYKKENLRYTVYIHKTNLKIIVKYLELGTHPDYDTTIMLSDCIDNFIDDIVRAGFVEKRCEMSRLSGREQAVWDKRNAGLTFKQIAEELGLCPATVSFAYRKAYRKIEYEKERLKPTEREVYKRALENISKQNFPYPYYEKAREQWLDNVLDKARKELEDERK